MKKSTLLLSLFLFLNTIIIAQYTPTKKAKVVWGSESKESRKSTLKDVIGTDKNGFYVLKSKGHSTLIIERYNTKSTKTHSEELVLKYQKKPLMYEGYLQVGEKIYLFTSFKNKKQKMNYLFVQSLNKKTLLLNNDLKKIADINYAGKGVFNSGSYSFELSEDGSKFLVFYNLPYLSLIHI